MNRELSNRVQDLITTLSQGLVEREQHIKLMLLAALAGEHVLLIGPPGTAKSLLARRLRLAFRDAKFFERLLTQFSVPEDLFGPYSLEDLDSGRYRRLTEGYLADADVGFLDEIFKSNPSILNALLTLLNERVFHNVPPKDNSGKNASDAPQPLPVPLKCLIGASNEVPAPGELDALYDRFLIRCEVGPVENFHALLQSASNKKPQVNNGLPFTAEELQQIQDSSEKVIVPEQVDELLLLLRQRMGELQWDVSDRRWLKIRCLLQVAAYTNGRKQVSPLDMLLVPHCVWSPRQDMPQNVPSNNKGDEDQKQPPRPVEIRNGLIDWLQERLWEPTQGLIERQIAVWEKTLQALAKQPPENRDVGMIESGVRETETLLKRTDILLQALSAEMEVMEVARSVQVAEKNGGKSPEAVAGCLNATKWTEPEQTLHAMKILEGTFVDVTSWKERIETAYKTFHQLQKNTTAQIQPPNLVFESTTINEKCGYSNSARPEAFDFGHSPEEAMIVAPKYQQDWAQYLAAHPAVQSSTREVIHTFKKNKYATPWTIEFMLIPPGEFINKDEKTTIIEQPFLFSKYPITRKQWQLAAVGPNTWDSKWSGDELPAFPLTYADGTAFCQRLNEIQGINSGYRHPTSDEWEYACRAGTSTFHWFGDEYDSEKSLASIYPSSRNKAAHFHRLRALKVDDKKNAENPFGLCGMHGNVYELCADTGDKLIACGGFFGTNVTKYPGRLYSSFKMSLSKNQASFNAPMYDDGSGAITSDAIGFRLVKSIDL